MALVGADRDFGREVEPERHQTPRFGVVLLGGAADYIVALVIQPCRDFRHAHHFDQRIAQHAPHGKAE